VIYGLFLALSGISAIIFNKYPGKKASLTRVHKKYKDIDNKTVAKVDGIYSIIVGIFFIIFSLISSVYLKTYILLFIMIITLIYFLLQPRLLNMLK
ncbi:MAG: hypothetical protein VB130_17125, partial [Clostridium sp.]|nr:hypothetical protein [Clostridium sp.]